jgi:hypothetical protein
MNDWSKLTKSYGGKWVVLDKNNKVIVNDVKLEKALDKFRVKHPKMRPSVFKVPTRLAPYVG